MLTAFCAAQTAASTLLQPYQIGGCGCCTGLVVMTKSFTVVKRPS
jgi:hypothetical protein